MWLESINDCWECKTLTSCTHIVDWFDNCGIYGKKIKHIYMGADVLFLNRQHFIDLYNNSNIHESFFKKLISYHDEFDFSFISPDRVLSRYVPNGGPIIFLFDDGTTFEFFSSDYGIYHLSENALKDKLSDLPRGNLDIEKMFYKILGTSIVDVKIRRYEKNDYELYYVNRFKAPIDPVFVIKLVLDNGMQLFMKHQTFALMNEKNALDVIRFDEYMECIYDKEKCLNK